MFVTFLLAFKCAHHTHAHTHTAPFSTFIRSSKNPFLVVSPARMLNGGDSEFAFYRTLSAVPFSPHLLSVSALFVFQPFKAQDHLAFLLQLLLCFPPSFSSTKLFICFPFLHLTHIPLSFPFSLPSCSTATMLIIVQHLFIFFFYLIHHFALPLTIEYLLGTANKAAFFWKFSNLLYHLAIWLVVDVHHHLPTRPPWQHTVTVLSNYQSSLTVYSINFISTTYAFTRCWSSSNDNFAPFHIDNPCLANPLVRLAQLFLYLLHSLKDGYLMMILFLTLSDRTSISKGRRGKNLTWNIFLRLSKQARVALISKLYFTFRLIL